MLYQAVSLITDCSIKNFSLLMCNLETAEDAQISFLQEILLHGGHDSPEPWLNYSSYLRRHAPHRKFLLKRLLTKVFKLIDIEKHRDNRFYIELHLLMTELLDDEDAIEYFESSVWTARVGRRSAAVYMSWAKRVQDPGSSMKILQRVNISTTV